MRTITVMPQRRVAVVAQDPKSRRVGIIFQPSLNWPFECSPMRRAGAINMVDSQKFKVALTATLAFVRSVAVVLYGKGAAFAIVSLVTLAHNWIKASLSRILCCRFSTVLNITGLPRSIGRQMPIPIILFPLSGLGAPSVSVFDIPFSSIGRNALFTPVLMAVLRLCKFVKIIQRPFVAAPAALLRFAHTVIIYGCATVWWTQLTGAAADPDGAGALYQVDVWKH